MTSHRIRKCALVNQMARAVGQQEPVMASGEGRRIEPEIDDKNVRPAVSVEIGDKDHTRLNRSGHLTRDYLCSTIDVTAPGLTTSDDHWPPGRVAAEATKDHVRNPVTIEVCVTAPLTRGQIRMPNRRQNGYRVDRVWNPVVTVRATNVGRQRRRCRRWPWGRRWTWAWSGQSAIYGYCAYGEDENRKRGVNKFR